MKTIDLGQLEWSMSGWTPDMWRLLNSMELGSSSRPEIVPIPCRVPCSVQAVLKDAGILPDWNVGMNSRSCEWVENRHWMFETRLPDVEGPTRLHFEGLDGPGEVWLDGRCILTFANSFIPFEADVTGSLSSKAPRVLRVIFLAPPRWLGQCGYSSTIKDWKPRFNYTWDWTPRNVQIGIFKPARLLTGIPSALEDLSVFTTLELSASIGAVHFSGLPRKTGSPIEVRLLDGNSVVHQGQLPDGANVIGGLSMQAWQPNGNGDAKLYRLEVTCGDDRRVFQIGFRHISWHPCQGADPSADPWICRINGTDTFLQGINWTPIRPHFADLKREDYLQRLTTYRDMGLNCIRIWGGGFAEHSWLYEICDDLGLLIWQDFPLSSSGIDNWPPEDPEVMEQALTIAQSYIRRLQSHASLLLWCGGNELQGALDGGKVGIGKPAGLDHPLLAGFDQTVRDLDPFRRFAATTSTGPRFMANGADFGKNLHWDVHGPWVADMVDLVPWQDYWIKDDALFRSEMGNPGAQSAELIRQYVGDCKFHDANLSNPYWQRVGWWFELDKFLAERGNVAWDIEDYVEWSQRHQAEKLSFAVQMVKSRFPSCGGLILWMGHDSFPCAVNTSLLDFDGGKKPVCEALTPIFKSQP